MAAEASKENVENLCSILNIAPSHAISLLKNHDNDINAAISAYFGDPAQPAEGVSGWEETPFRSDSWDSNAFSIDATDDSIPIHLDEGQNRPDTAPTRPNSRNQGTASTDFATITHYGGPLESEDEDLKRAIEMSSQDQPDQESGVTDSRGYRFGPATGSNYNISEWSMTMTGQAHTQTHEILLDPEPHLRQRGKDNPAFFKPYHNAPFLSSLLTILHHIPLAQNLLLASDCLLDDYGTGEKWWTGVPVSSSRVIQIDADPELLNAEEVLFETQRLMAFLKKTERAYGSIEVLANIDLEPNLENALSSFLNKWIDYASSSIAFEDIPRAFHSSATRSFVDGTKEPVPFSVLDVLVENQFADKGLSLYESLDSLIWPDTMQKDTIDAYIDSVGHIMTFMIQRQDAFKDGAGLKIPATWYADRYLEANKLFSLEMREEKRKLFDTLKKFDDLEQQLKEFPVSDGSGKTVDPLALLRMSSDYLDSPEADQEDSEEDDIDYDLLGEDGDLLRQLAAERAQMAPRFKEAATECRSYAEALETRLKKIQDDREEARSSLKHRSKLFTDSSPEDPAKEPQYPYTLRGVATGPSTTYVLKKIEGEDEETTADARARGFQWWKTDFDATAGSPVTVTRVQELQVLKAAREVGKRVLLVYASAKAMTTVADEALPEPLENFVAADNAHFQSELSQPQSRFPMTPPSDVSDAGAENGDWEDDRRQEEQLTAGFSEWGLKSSDTTTTATAGQEGGATSKTMLGNSKALETDTNMDITDSEPQEMQELSRPIEASATGGASSKRKVGDATGHDGEGLMSSSPSGVPNDSKAVRFDNDAPW